MSRRTVFRAAGAAGAVVAGGGAATGIVTGAESASADTAGAGIAAGGQAGAGPVVAYLSSTGSSEVEIFSDLTKITIRDPALAARLASAAADTSGPASGY